MPSKCFIINEWLLHDLSGENGENAQREAAMFLNKLKEKCDRIAILKGSPWAEKAYALMRHTDPIVQGLSKDLHLNILLDSKKCQQIDEQELAAIPQDVSSLVPDEDIYLVQIYFSVDAVALVTSDEKFHQRLSTKQQGMQIVLREEFLRQYFTE